YQSVSTTIYLLSYLAPHCLLTPFFNDTPTPPVSFISLRDALPISLDLRLGAVELRQLVRLSEGLGIEGALVGGLLAALLALLLEAVGAVEVLRVPLRAGLALAGRDLREVGCGGVSAFVGDADFGRDRHDDHAPSSEVFPGVVVDEEFAVLLGEGEVEDAAGVVGQRPLALGDPSPGRTD